MRRSAHISGPTGLSKSDADLISELGGELNRELKAAARRHCWTMADGIDEDFAGHGYCSGQSYYVFAEESCERQCDLENIMHPNYKGTHAAAARLEAILTAELDKLGAASWRPHPRRAPSGPAGRTKPKLRNERVPAKPAKPRPRVRRSLWLPGIFGITRRMRRPR